MKSEGLHKQEGSWILTEGILDKYLNRNCLSYSFGIRQWSPKLNDYCCYETCSTTSLLPRFSMCSQKASLVNSVKINSIIFCSPKFSPVTGMCYPSPCWESGGTFFIYLVSSASLPAQWAVWTLPIHLLYFSSATES